jgi:acyl-CoA synthetase (AMP-forming)/AMP-acid ligase II
MHLCRSYCCSSSSSGSESAPRTYFSDLFPTATFSLYRRFPSLQRDLPAFKAKVSHCKAKLALSNKYYLRTKWPIGIKESLSWFRPGTESWPTLDWIDVESLDFSADVSTFELPKPTRDSPAFIQYSSGSTGSPKGAIITHYNLLWQAYVLVNHHPPPLRIVSWAPHWHDLGFNLNFICPHYTNANLTVLFSPLDFLKSPLLWLRTISSYRGTVSVNPTFAYSLVTLKVTDAELAQLDLSGCTFYMGAEPMNPFVIQRFLDRFKSAGVTKEQLLGTYGLAGTTFYSQLPIKCKI